MWWTGPRIIMVLLITWISAGCGGSRACPACQVIAPVALPSPVNFAELGKRLTVAFGPRTDRTTEQRTMLMLVGAASEPGARPCSTAGLWPATGHRSTW